MSNLQTHPNVVGILSDLIEVDTSYQVAAESALGEYNNYLVVDSKKYAETLISNSSHCLSIFSLDSVPQVLLRKSEYPAKSLYRPAL